MNISAHELSHGSKNEDKKGGKGRKVTLFAPDKGFIDKIALARSWNRVFAGLLSNIIYTSIFMCHRVGYIFTMITNSESIQFVSSRI